MTGPVHTLLRLVTFGKLRPDCASTFWRLVRPDFWKTPVIVALGLVTSLAETLSISFVLLFLYSALGQPINPASLGLPAGLGAGLLPLGHGSATAVVIFVLIVAKSLTTLAYGLLAAQVRSRIDETVRNDLHGAFLTMPYEDFRAQEQGDLLNLIASESWSVAEFFLASIRALIGVGAVAVFCTVLFYLSWKITIVALVGSAALFGVSRLLALPIRRLGSETKHLNQSLARLSLLVIQGMRTLRAYGSEAQRQATFEGASKHARTAGFRLEMLYGILSPLTEVGYLALLCLIILFSGALGETFATTLATVALLYRLQPHVHQLEANLLALGQHEASAHAVLRQMARLGHLVRPKGRSQPRPLRDIRFERVSFTHQGADRPSLDDVTFTLPAGKTTAIVGPSGAGKTTIVNLLLRLYAPSSGAILVGDERLDTIGAAEWHASVSIAGQDAEAIDGTIDENIRLAEPMASQDAILRALEIAGLAEFVARLPHGIHTGIGQRGLNVSGGQRQRLGLARAVLRDAELLILDEATSALDVRLERQVNERLHASRVGRTTLLITHRPENIRLADHVICLDEGHVVEAGSPDALLAGENRLLRFMLEGDGPSAAAAADRRS